MGQGPTVPTSPFQGREGDLFPLSGSKDQVQTDKGDFGHDSETDVRALRVCKPNIRFFHVFVDLIFSKPLYSGRQVQVEPLDIVYKFMMSLFRRII